MKRENENCSGIADSNKMYKKQISLKEINIKITSKRK